jgi:hypothetical protein
MRWKIRTAAVGWAIRLAATTVPTDLPPTASGTIGGGPTVTDDKPMGLTSAEISALIYELLDAHGDTADMAAQIEHDPEWAAHLDYLCALQRKGREALASLSGP